MTMILLAVLTASLLGMVLAAAFLDCRRSGPGIPGGQKLEDLRAEGSVTRSLKCGMIPRKNDEEGEEIADHCGAVHCLGRNL